MWTLDKIALLGVLGALGCTPQAPGLPAPAATGETTAATAQRPAAAGSDAGRCGALSYGIHDNPGDTFDDIAKRTIGTIACATPCDPKPAFATRPIGRNEHGGYGFLDLDARYCQFAGMSLAIKQCHAVCDAHDKLGKLSIDLAHQTEGARGELCMAFEQRRGRPDVGSCDCLKDDIVWRPSPTQAGVVLYFMGHYTLDCGFPDGNYVPGHYPGE